MLLVVRGQSGAFRPSALPGDLRMAVLPLQDQQHPPGRFRPLFDIHVKILSKVLQSNRSDRFEL